MRFVSYQRNVGISSSQKALFSVCFICNIIISAPKFMHIKYTSGISILESLRILNIPQAIHNGEYNCGLHFTRSSNNWEFDVRFCENIGLCEGKTCCFALSQ
jgi:hypothetical protein